MKCPYCNHKETDVRDSRPCENYIRRRRRCCSCKATFTTFEFTEADRPLTMEKYRSYVIKKLEAAIEELKNEEGTGIPA